MRRIGSGLSVLVSGLALLSCSRDLAVPGGGPPPELGLVSPCRDGVSSPCHDNALVSGDVTVQVARTGGGQLSAVELWTAGIEAAKLTAPPWSWTLHTKELYPVGGVMAVYVTPIDEHGVRASPVQFSFVVDNAGPDVSITSPAHDTTWPMTLPVAVAVCAFDVQAVASVTASAGQVRSALSPSGTCPDGRAQYTGTVAAPGGAANTLAFDLVVQAADARGNVSYTYVPLVATRQRWSRATHTPAAAYGGASLPVRQTVQHGFRAYTGGVAMQTGSGSGGYVFWMPADGSPPATMDPWTASTTRYSFVPYGDGLVAVVVGGAVSPSPVQFYAPVAGTPTLLASNAAADWSGIGSLVGYGDAVGCLATFASGTNPLFKRIACFNHDGSARFSLGLDQVAQLADDISAVAVAGDVVLVLRQPSSGCTTGLQLDRYTPAGTLMASSPCIGTRPLPPYVHADAYGAVVSTDVMAAHVDPTGVVTNLTAVTGTYGDLLAGGASRRLLWAKRDLVLLRTVVSITSIGGTLLASTTLPYAAAAPIGVVLANTSDRMLSDAAAFDAAGNAYLVLRESSVEGDVFHVVSVSGDGALRWDYTATTPIMALSLSPSSTSEPVYLLHDEGTVEALVR